jgi:hypothetical protein
MRGLPARGRISSRPAGREIRGGDFARRLDRAIVGGLSVARRATGLVRADFRADGGSSDVRPLRDHNGAGGDPAIVRNGRVPPKLSAPLQRITRPGPAGHSAPSRERRSGPWDASLGPDPLLVE